MPSKTCERSPLTGNISDYDDANRAAIRNGLPMELSDGQFEHIVGLLAENRVAINNVSSELQAVERRLLKEIGVVSRNAELTHALATAIEEDVGKVQTQVRRVSETQRTTIASYDQTLDGIVQLGRSTFDMVESIQKQVHEELRRPAHDDITQEGSSQRQQ